MNSMDFSDFGSWGLQSFSSDFQSFTLQSWRGADGGTPGVERTFRNLGGQETFFHRNEVILRCGEMPNMVHLIMDGSLQVLAFGAFSESHPSTALEVGRLEPGETLAVLPWLERRPSRFSFRVQSKSVTSIMLRPDITSKAENFFRERLGYKESAKEELWEASAWQQFEERARVQEEKDAEQKGRMDWSGLKTREGYLIPPECLMACHPNLRRATPRREPPPPVVTKSLPEIQRDLRIAKMDEKDRPQVQKANKAQEELDLSALLSMDGGHRAGVRGKLGLALNKPGDVFHPKTSTDANLWRRSDAFRFCQRFPVFQPELTEGDRRQGDALAAQEAKELADRKLRQSMGRMIGVLMQVKRVIKSGASSFRGSRIRDTDDFLKAMAGDETEKLQRNHVADAITGLGVADEEVEELVAKMDSENTGQIDREELADALMSPKRSIKQIYRKLRITTVGSEVDSWFSSDGEESDRLLDFTSSEEEDDDRNQRQVLSPKRFSLALPPAQQKPDRAAYNALPARPLSAPIRGKVIEKPVAPKPVGKFHAMQRRLRKRQLRKASSGGPSELSQRLACRILMETTALLDDEKSSRLPSSIGTPMTPITPRK